MNLEQPTSDWSLSKAVNYMIVGICALLLSSCGGEGGGTADEASIVSSVEPFRAAVSPGDNFVWSVRALNTDGSSDWSSESPLVLDVQDSENEASVENRELFSDSLSGPSYDIEVMAWARVENAQAYELRISNNHGDIVAKQIQSSSVSCNESTCSARIEPVAHTADAVSPAIEMDTSTISGNVPFEVALSVLGTAGDGAKLSGNWDIEGRFQAFPAGDDFYYEFTAPGQYVVNYTVTDVNGLMSTASVPVDVLGSEGEAINTANSGSVTYALAAPLAVTPQFTTASVGNNVPLASTAPVGSNVPLATTQSVETAESAQNNVNPFMVAETSTDNAEIVVAGLSSTAGTDAPQVGSSAEPALGPANSENSSNTVPEETTDRSEETSTSTPVVAETPDEQQNLEAVPEVEEVVANAEIETDGQPDGVGGGNIESSVIDETASVDGNDSASELAQVQEVDSEVAVEVETAEETTATVLPEEVVETTTVVPTEETTQDTTPTQLPVVATETSTVIPNDGRWNGATVLDDSLPMAGVFYGNPSFGNQLGNARIAFHSSRRFRAEKTGDVVAVRYNNRVLGFSEIASRCSRGSPSSYYCRCHNAGLDEYSCGYSMGGAYHVGNGGLITIEIREDDGSANHLPKNEVLGKIREPYSPVSIADQHYPIFELESPVRLEAGKIYHLVYNNARPPVKCGVRGESLNKASGCERDRGAISLNGIYFTNRVGDTGMYGPFMGDTSANLVSNNTTANGGWNLDDNNLSWYEVQYSDGIWVGDAMSAPDTRFAGKATIAGSTKARQIFTVRDATRRVNGLWLNFGHTRTANGRNLTATLKDGSGQTISSTVIPASSACRTMVRNAAEGATPQLRCMEWVYGDFGNTIELKQGSSYSVEFAAPSGAGFILNTYTPNISRPFESESRNFWHDARAELSNNSGSSWQVWTEKYVQRDLPLLFTTEGNPKQLD